MQHDAAHGLATLEIGDHGAKGCRAVAAAAAASGFGFLARARAAALVGKAALAALTRPLWMATPLSAAAATTHKNAHANAGLPSHGARQLDESKDHPTARSFSNRNKRREPPPEATFNSVL
ncbi:hypothetical protein WN55_05556 [Dufourea novaeangliae]|uniref:Uncharacterized protein n=1 Tax=Dufourea novaeangliae TaxID=178035 RepID=A0A154PQ49_DUFNO|nr:hypothetical protein WN55_05556 [Dufourea novaeangliae]